MWKNGTQSCSACGKMNLYLSTFDAEGVARRGAEIAERERTFNFQLSMRKGRHAEEQRSQREKELSTLSFQCGKGWHAEEQRSQRERTFNFKLSMRKGWHAEEQRSQRERTFNFKLSMRKGWHAEEQRSQRERKNFQL
jgi:hypothetical protein